MIYGDQEPGFFPLEGQNKCRRFQKPWQAYPRFWNNTVRGSRKSSAGGSTPHSGLASTRTTFFKSHSSARQRWDDRPEEMAPFPWLYRIVMNGLCDEWRLHNRVALGGLKCEVPWPDRSSAQFAASVTSPSEALARNELIERVHKVLESLDDEDRNVLTMQILDELTFWEIADVLGVNVNRAAYLFSRAMRRFKKIWQQLDRG